MLIIKLADRLHNMRTLRFQPTHKQQRTARATLEVLAPLASRLGLQVIRRDLEDLAVLHPAEHDEIVRVVDQRDPGRRDHVVLVRQVAADLQAAKTKATVTPHPRPLLDLPDDAGAGQPRDPRLTASWSWSPARLGDCYIALGAVHGRWHPVRAGFETSSPPPS